MFETLPNDPYLLLSVVNTKLRDSYESLDNLCDDLNIDKNEILSKLNSLGYNYNQSTNQFC